MRNGIFYLTLFVVGLLIAGCTGMPAPFQPRAATPTPPAELPAGTDALAGTSWVLTSLNGQPPLADTTITISFGADGALAGSDGCNRYSTSYTLDGANLKIKQPIAATMMACPEPVMNQATAYMKALEQATTIKVDSQQLVLLDAAGKELVTFAAQSTGLAGTSWNVIAYNNGKGGVVSVIAGTTLTANFGTDGKLTGSAGCNSYTAGYETDGKQTIKIGPAAATKKFCAEPAGTMDQETQYLAALQTAATYKIEGDKMEMRTADGALAATFAAQSTDLAGTSWNVIAYNNGKGGVVSVIAGTTLTADFSADGKLTGSAGCNNYTASCETDGKQTIKIGPAATTRMFCGEPVGVMDQETQYLTALQSATTYRIDGDKMEMRTADGALVATFNRTVSSASAPSASAPSLQPGQIRLDTQGLPYSWQPVLIPATPYDASMPPGPVGLPEHVEILFGVTNPADRKPSDPVMYIIPVIAYRQMWDQAGNPAVTRTIEQIEKLSFALPSPAPTSGLPALPPEQIGAGYNDLAVQVGRAVPTGQLNTTSATQTGYRFVGRWAQDANPVTNQGLRYVYQGFTNDGKYLVSFWYPVSTPALPNDITQVPADQISQFNADPQAQIASVAVTLNDLPTGQWQPDLATLDALVASLQIEGMPVAGIYDRAWRWTEGPAQPGSSENVKVGNPELYQVTYGSDGTIQFKADCNTGGMSYELRQGGMAGGMLAQPGPMTLAECGPQSLYNGFVNSLLAAQNYRVRAGGDRMELILPAGGGVLLFE